MGSPPSHCGCSAIIPAQVPHLVSFTPQIPYVQRSQYEPTRFHLFAFNFRFSGFDDVDEIVVEIRRGIYIEHVEHVEHVLVTTDEMKEREMEWR